MKKLAIVVAVGALIVSVTGTAHAAVWVPFEFTGADLWSYSLHWSEISPNPTDEGAQYQPSPRRHHDVWKSAGIHTTWSPYGDESTELGAYADTFANWAASSAGQAYQIDSFNLWGGDLSNAKNLFAEKYLSHPNAADHGVSSWRITATPSGWTGTVIPSSWLPNRGYPEWYVNDGIGITQANANDPSLVFGFDVLIENPDTAFEDDGTMRVWFGGTAYDELVASAWTNEGFDGVMTLTPIPEPASVIVWSLLGGLGITIAWWRRRRKAA